MRYPRIIKVIILSLIPLLMLLLLGEIFSRVRLYIKNKDYFYLIGPFFEKKQSFERAQVNYEFKIVNFLRDEDRYFKFKPGPHPPPAPYTYGKISINSLGFRGKDFAPKNKGNKIRIFCIGESSTFGAESPDDQTWPARLEFYLNKKDKASFEVINSGFPGYASFNYSSLIRHELVNYNPDMFIIYAGVNDVNRNNQLKKINKFMLDIHNFLYYRSMLYTLLSEKISLLLHNSPVPAHIFEVKDKENFSKNIEKIIQVCRSRNIRLIFVRQILHTKKELLLNDDYSVQEIKAVLENKSADPEDKIYTTGYITFYRHNQLMNYLFSIAQKYNIEFLDFRKDFYNALKNKEDIFNDDVHFKPKGNDFLARLISQNIF